MNKLKKQFDFIELEDRLEMVQLAALEAADSECVGNNGCDQS